MSRAHRQTPGSKLRCKRIGRRPGFRRWRYFRFEARMRRRRLLLVCCESTLRVVEVAAGRLGEHSVEVRSDVGDDLPKPVVCHRGATPLSAIENTRLSQSISASTP